MLVRCWFAGTGPAPPARCRACGHAGVRVVPAAGAGTAMAAGAGPAPPARCRACGHAGVGVVLVTGAGTAMAASNGSVPDRRFLPCGCTGSRLSSGYHTNYSSTALIY